MNKKNRKIEYDALVKAVKDIQSLTTKTTTAQNTVYQHALAIAESVNGKAEQRKQIDKLEKEVCDTMGWYHKDLGNADGKRAKDEPAIATIRRYFNTMRNALEIATVAQIKEDAKQKEYSIPTACLRIRQAHNKALKEKQQNEPANAHIQREGFTIRTFADELAKVKDNLCLEQIAAKAEQLAKILVNDKDSREAIAAALRHAVAVELGKSAELVDQIDKHLVSRAIF